MHACSHTRTAASAAVLLRMAAAPSSVRRSTRASQQPLSLAEEQAASALSLLEQRDIAAALRLSLHDSWDSDEEKSGAQSDDDADAAMEEEEEEKEAAAPAEQEGEWTSKLHDITLPLPAFATSSSPRPVRTRLCSYCSAFLLEWRFESE